MTEIEQNIWNAITSYMNGNPTSEEMDLLDHWMLESDGNRKFFELVVSRQGKPMDVYDETRERIYRQIQETVLPAGKKRHLGIRIGVAAASIAILVFFTISYYYSHDSSQAKVAYLETTTPFGVKTKVVLSDGSLVYLNSGATLHYPAQFSGKTREVELEGEAYFEVSKNIHHPFLVHTLKATIRVLGTHFNVKSFPEEKVFETTLLEGSVALYLPSHPRQEVLRLKPNQKAKYDQLSGGLHLAQVDGELETSWRNNKLYFDNVSLPSIMKCLERDFNTPIRVGSKGLEEETFSGFFDRTRNIYQILDIMKLHKNFYYTTDGDTLRIFKKK